MPFRLLKKFKRQRDGDVKGVQIDDSYDLGDDHQCGWDEFLQRFKTKVNTDSPQESYGLSNQQAKLSEQEYGRNALSPPKDKPEVVKYLLHYLAPFMLMLEASSIALFGVYGSDPTSQNLILAVALAITVFILCTLDYFQERSAGNVMKSLTTMLPATTCVIRDGSAQDVNAVDLVPGDVVLLTLGNRVPADVRILQSSDFKVEASSLTGESALVPLSPANLSPVPQDAGNVAFMSSMVMSGSALGVVVRTGDNTMIGSIAKLASATSHEKSTLQKEVERFIYFVAIVALSMAVLMFSISMARGLGLTTSFVNGFIIVMIANVPQGLPATVTLMLAVTVRKLKEVFVLVKRPDIVETLGAATIIASDKTGTLTMNRMTVQQVWVNRSFRAVSQLLPGNFALERTSTLERRSYAQQNLQRYSTVSRDLQQMSPPTQRPSPLTSMHVGTLERRSAVQMALQTISPLPVPPPRASMDLDMIMAYQVQVRKQSVESTHPHEVKPSDSDLAQLGRESRYSHSSFVRESKVYGLGSVVEPSLASLDWAQASAVERMLIISLVCNKAEFKVEGDVPDGSVAVQMNSENKGFNLPLANPDETQATGNATDIALLRFGEKVVSTKNIRAAFRPVFDVPFSSSTKYAYTVVEGDALHGGQQLLIAKGAPEYVLERCTHYLYNQREREVEDEFREEFGEAYNQFGLLGQRVIACAYKELAAKPTQWYETVQAEAEDDHAKKVELESFSRGWVFVGMASIMDPPRPSVPGAIAECQMGGIRVAMVTGDHPLTAESIARKVGIITNGITRRELAEARGVMEQSIPWFDPDITAAVLSGTEIKAGLHTDEEWDAVLSKKELVFARTTPQQKLQIVEHLQRNGEVVAVTGDGVNDAPALKRANIGAAMGGPDASDVAREAADIILLDDNFGSLVNAIQEGRTVFDNLTKSVLYTISHIMPEVMSTLYTVVFSLPLPLNSLLVLSVDLATEQVPSASFAYEPAESSVMRRPPRRIGVDRLITRNMIVYIYLVVGIVEAAFSTLAYFIVFWWHDINLRYIWYKGDDYWVSADAPLTLKNGRVLSVDEQFNIYAQAQAAYYLTLIMCQFWHVFHCKTRKASIYKHPIFANHVTYYGIIVEVAIMCLIIYVPFLQSVFDTAAPPGIAWLVHLAFLVFIHGYSEMYKWFARNRPQSWVARYLAY